MVVTVSAFPNKAKMIFHYRTKNLVFDEVETVNATSGVYQRIISGDKSDV